MPKDLEVFLCYKLLLSEFQPYVEKLISLHQAHPSINNNCEDNVCYYGHWSDVDLPFHIADTVKLLNELVY